MPFKNIVEKGEKLSFSHNVSTLSNTETII